MDEEHAARLQNSMLVQDNILLQSVEVIVLEDKLSLWIRRMFSSPRAGDYRLSHGQTWGSCTGRTPSWGRAQPMSQACLMTQSSYQPVTCPHSLDLGESMS